MYGAHACMYAALCMLVSKLKYIPTRQHVYVCVYKYKCIHTHTHTHTHTHRHKHIHSYPCMSPFGYFSLGIFRFWFAHCIHITNTNTHRHRHRHRHSYSRMCPFRYFPLCVFRIWFAHCISCKILKFNFPVLGSVIPVTVFLHMYMRTCVCTNAYVRI